MNLNHPKGLTFVENLILLFFIKYLSDPKDGWKWSRLLIFIKFSGKETKNTKLIDILHVDRMST